MSARERGENRVFVDDTLSRAGIDLWGAAANAAAFTLAPALPTAISLLARIDPQALGGLEHGDAGAYRAEYKHLNARLDAAADGLVTALRDKGHRASAAAATIYSDLPESGDWLAAGVFAHKTAGHAGRPGLDRQDGAVRVSRGRPEGAPRHRVHRSGARRRRTGDPGPLRELPRLPRRLSGRRRS